MRIQWIVSILSTLVSMGVLVIIMGQNELSSMLTKGSEKLQMASDKLENQLITEDIFKGTVERLLAQGEKVMKDLEASVTMLNKEIEKKKTESDACQTEKKTKSDELADTEKKLKETEASLKTESDAWTQELDSLKVQLTAPSQICNYVKNNPLALKLCDS